EVEAGDAEASGSHVLDGAVTGVAVGIEHVAGGVFAAFTGVALAAEAVHGDGQSFMRLFTDGAIRHGPRLEPLENTLCRLDLLDGNRSRGSEIEQPAQGAPLLRLLVDQRGVFLEH